MNVKYSHSQGTLNFTGSSSPSSIGLPALPKEIFWSEVGSSSQKGGQEAKAPLGLN